MFNKKYSVIIFVTLIIVLLAGSVTTAYFLIKKQANIKLVNQQNQARLSENSLSPEMEKQVASEEASEAAIEASSTATSTGAMIAQNLLYPADEATITPEVLIKPVAGYLPKYDYVYATSGPINFATTTPGLKNIQINWTQAVTVKQRDFFSKKYKTIAALSSTSYEMIFKIPVQEFPGTYPWSILKVGEISSSSDEYVDQDVYQIFTTCDRYGCDAPFTSMFVITDKKTQRLIVLSRYSKYNPAALESDIGGIIFEDDDSLYVGQFENPDEISIPGITNKFKKTSNNYLAEVSYKFSDPGSRYVGDTSNGKRLYITYDGCFIVYNDNGGYAMYQYDYGIPLSTMAATLDLTFKDGVKNEDDYVNMPVGGCGSHGCANLAGAKSSELKVVGKFGNGDTAYEYRSANATIKSYYQNIYSISGIQSGQDKLSISDFMVNNGIILRKLPFKDFYLLYLKANYMPYVECGKPVIYLYPKKTEDIEVQVSPTGGLSITEPTYNDGWSVQATPASDILNYADGKNYPYLFWEGKGLFYQRPSEGFMVARVDVDKFLNEKLAALGLVQKEINDFKEYWLPKMQAKPYYFVTFLPQDQFNEIAPLSVSPKPDTVIRVFMDYQGLSKPEKVVEPIIKTPKRVGFTVVEWGGALGRK